MNLKIGILIPRSDISPLFPQQVVRGIKMGFEKLGLAPQFIIEDIGKAVLADVVMGKANTLLMEDVDITFAWVGRKVADDLKKLYAAAQKPLLLMSAGVSVDTENEMGIAPYVFSNSLDTWQSTSLLGKYVGQHYKGNLLNSVGFFECGYNFSALFSEGFENDENKIVGTHISKKMEDIDFTETLPQMMEQVNPDMFTAFYSGIDAEKFYKLCVESNITKGLPIITLGFGSMPYKNTNYPVINAQCWDISFDNQANQAFVSDFTTKHKTTPDAYTMIAYETAFAAAKVLSNTDNDNFDALKFCTALQKSETNGPRGVLTFDSATQKNNSFATIISDGGKTTVVAPYTADEIKIFMDDFATRIQAGWFNPYPCA
jgi:branched-chain amino acid transport system substrate-binding protein